MRNATPKRKDNPSKNDITIVGIGASAGGLNALKELLEHIPDNTNIAIVIIVHLSPEYKSQMAEILQPHTKMKVIQVNKTTEIKSNHVYIIPPNANLNSVDSHLRLSKLEEDRGKRAPVDHFFRTLAKTHDGKSVGIILTGTGSDGTLGIKAIKEKGGLTIVQVPSEAAYDGMPQSALSTGLVDKVLSINKIGPYIKNYLSTTPKISALTSNETPDEKELKLIQKIFSQIRARTNRDFSRYKVSTILRRLQRRMQIYQIEQIEEYIEILRKNPEEVRALSDDFLINVTNFFRDPEVYKYLEANVIPKIFENKSDEDEIRVWSIGCATGEEAYSIAMLLNEEASKMDFPPTIQLFASDLHEDSLKKARDGFYPGDIKTDVSENRLKKFFTKEDGGYKIRKEIRELVIFTPHNLLGDPPFSRLDLLLCRNLLIYLKRDIQRDVFELMHYSLVPDGYMVLGSSEHLESMELFSTYNKKLSVYKKKNVNGPEPRLPVFPKSQNHMREEKIDKKEQELVSFGSLHQKLVEQYAPPSILLSPDYQVLHISETAGRYLSVSGGEITRDISKLLATEIHFELRSIIHEAKNKNEMIRSRALGFNIEGQKKELYLSVRIVKEPSRDYVVLVIFEEYKETKEKSVNELKSSENKNNLKRIEQLENDLIETHQRLQTIIEEYETSREEMKASNEELQSANEELRSTMEELETSKEELQSMNEELSTLNQENRLKVEELRQLSDDLQNLLAATNIATLFLDRDLRILRFTPRLGDIFNVRIADHGRLISDQTHKLGYDNLIEDANKVLKTLQPIDKEVKDSEGHTYICRILPYRSAEDHIDGIVITFIDITERKKAEEELRNSEERYRTLIDISAAMVWVTDKKGNVIEDSPTWRKFTGQTYEEWKGWRWLEAIHPDDRKNIEKSWKSSVNSKTTFYNKFRVYHAATKTYKWTSVSAAPLKNKNNEIQGWVGMNIDISELIDKEVTLQKSEERLSLILESAIDYAVLTFNKDGEINDWNRGAKNIFGYTLNEIHGKNFDLLYQPEDRSENTVTEKEETINNGRFESENWYLRKNGEPFWGSGSTMLLKDKKNSPRGFLKIVRDTTEKLYLEASLIKAKEESEKAAQAKEDFLAHMSHEIRTPLNAILGVGHLLMNQNPSKEQQDSLKILQYAGENLHGIINNILDLSKVEAGKMSIENNSFNLYELLDNIIKLHQSNADDQKLKLIFNLEKDVPEYIITDRLKFSQVLNNLLNNAIKFTNEGEVKLSVSCEKKQKDDCIIKFSVSDTGIGISNDKIDVIFDTFSQGDNSTARQYEGTGLGLTISKLYLNLLNSEIHVKSSPGKGSEFWFLLPVKEADEKKFTENSDKLNQTINEDLKKIRLLLVEDVKYNRMMFEPIFEMWGLQYKEVENGLEAVEEVKNNHYDIILMDVRMPIMDGYQATREIRSIDKYSEVPILALTADMSDKVKKEVEAGLFNDYLIKPVNPDRLKEIILKLVKLR